MVAISLEFSFDDVSGQFVADTSLTDDVELVFVPASSFSESLRVSVGSVACPLHDANSAFAVGGVSSDGFMVYFDLLNRRMRTNEVDDRQSGKNTRMEEGEELQICMKLSPYRTVDVGHMLLVARTRLRRRSPISMRAGETRQALSGEEEALVSVSERLKRASKVYQLII